MARAGYVEDFKFVDSSLGVPQAPGLGGILSPILYNIYLHEFDLYMQEYISIHSSQTQDKLIYKVNPRMTNYSDKLTELKKAYKQDHAPKVLRGSEIRSLRRNKIPPIIRTGNRISYVRYADDFIIGVIGDLEFATKIKENAKQFLANNLKLELNEEKTKITALTLALDKARFLGVDLHIPRANNSSASGKIVYCRKMNGSRGNNPMRINQVRMNFLMPYREILKDLAREGFLKEYTPGGPLITNAINK